MEESKKINNKTNTILKELKNIYGIDKCKDTINSYANYLELMKNGKIKFGNYNVFIKYKSDYTQVDKLVQIIIKLLKFYKIINSSYLYIEPKQLKNNYKINSIENQELVIVDSNIVNLTSISFFNSLKESMQNNKNTIFIVVYQEEKYYWGPDLNFNNIYWTFELDEISEKDKNNYIKQILKQNFLKIDTNCNLINIMCNKDYNKINQDLMNIVIGCKSKNIEKITNKVLIDLNKREYVKAKVSNTSITTTKKVGMQELNALEGLADVKLQVQRILNYIKINKDRGTLPSLHMCFNGNPRCWKNISCKNNWKNICRRKNII